MKDKVHTLPSFTTYSKRCSPSAPIGPAWQTPATIPKSLPGPHRILRCQSRGQATCGQRAHDDPVPRHRRGHRDKISCHSFRAIGITTYLHNGDKLEVAQQMGPAPNPSARPVSTVAATIPCRSTRSRRFRIDVVRSANRSLPNTVKNVPAKTRAETLKKPHFQVVRQLHPARFGYFEQ
jgi:hypothetical protein